jgi:hypothetical protein
MSEHPCPAIYLPEEPVFMSNLRFRLAQELDLFGHRLSKSCVSNVKRLMFECGQGQTTA